MNPIAAGFLVAAALLSPTFAPAYAQAPRSLGDPADPIVAAVNDEPILRSDVVSVQRTLPPQYRQLPFEVIFPAIIERLVDAKLVAAAGRVERLHDDPTIRRRVAQFEERVIQETYLNRKVEDAITEQALRQRYAKFVEDSPRRDQVSARHILVPTETKAREIIAELGKGGDFANLAKTHSIDPAGKQQGGDLGFFGRGDMAPEFAEAAFALKPGETTANPVKSQFGWHVIRVEERRSDAPPFEDVQEQLANDLSQELVGALVGRLRGAAKIELYGVDGAKPK